MLLNITITTVILLSVIYFGKILYFYYGLTKLQHGKNKKQYPVTIIIPARNEENNIDTCLNSLLKQKYPSEKMEIIVIDDNSNDGTAAIVREYCIKHPFVKLISLGQCPPGVSPKKRALQKGIDLADGEIIFTIDADCSAPVKWISKMLIHFEDSVGMVTGLVTFSKNDEKSFFHKIQSLEFLGLTMAGIGSIGVDDPIIANGANLAFRKGAFYEVGGYSGEDHIVSGDDDLLLQKIDRQTNWKIKTTIAPDTYIFTKPVSGFSSFINQRIRWASKGLIYKKIPLVLFLISVYIFYLLLLVLTPPALFFYKQFSFVFIAFLIKLSVDFLFVLKSTDLVGRKDLRKYFLVTEIFQIPYILYVSFVGSLGSFSWKDR